MSLATTVAATVAAGSYGTPAAGAVSDVVVNGGFESGTSGWYSSSGSGLSLAAGHTGSSSGRVTNTTSSALTVALNDKANSVAWTTKGARYTASAWVRVAAPGTSTGIRLMEYKGSTLVGQQVTKAWISDTAWHRVVVDYTAGSAGASLDLNVLAWSLPHGGTVDVDDVALTPDDVAAPAPTPAAPTGWRQVWSDEFDGASVDAAKWRVRNDTHNSNEASCLTNRPGTVSVSGGSLHIQARRESYTCNGYSAAFTSGYLDTIGKMSTTYGRYEIRAKLPTQQDTSKGMWPAFWLRPDDGGNGEIDIMEAVGSAAGESNYDRVSNTLWYDYKNTYPRQAASATLPSGTTMADGFHTYTAEWEPGVIRWYVDGRLTYTRDRSTTSWIDAAFSRPFNIRLNLQVGGSWAGAPTSATAFPADFQVDYVRVYQR